MCVCSHIDVQEEPTKGSGHGHLLSPSSTPQPSPNVKTTEATFLSDCTVTEGSTQPLARPRFQDPGYEHLKYISGKAGKKLHFVCIVCRDYPSVVRQYHPKRLLPPMCRNDGTEARSSTINSHLKSPYHEECMRLHRLSKLTLDQRLLETPVLTKISAKNKEIADKIGRLILQVYYDAKSLSLSAFSWPSKIVSAELGARFDYNKPIETIRDV